MATRGARLDCLILLLGLSAFVPRAAAEVTLPNIFGDHMVLQHGQPNRVWGRAAAGEEVTVSIDGRSKTARADDDGDWSVTLDPLDVGGPHELVVSGANQITISDVLVGEVWVCSGQSNMEWPVERTYDADLARVSANFPRIRMIDYPNVGAQTPIWTHDDSEWKVCDSVNVEKFSAVGYYFGKRLQETIDTPIGLIHDAWGGSAVEAWIAPEVLADHEACQETLARWRAMAARHKELMDRSDLNEDERKELGGLRRALSGNHRPSNIYNGVLKSHLGYGIKGAIWYQGESNAGRAHQYRELFPLMISSWRKEWGQGDFPFYWAQLADFTAEPSEPGESDWAELREAQTMTMKLPNTGQAVIIDVGEGYDIHPRNKQTVGDRLARWALANEYGVDIPCQSPTYQSVEFEGGKALLTFEHVHRGWRPFDVNKPVGFAIAGEDRRFVWAEAKILDDGRIEVWSDQVPEPVAVRYAWANNPVCNLFDRVGLPLTPFRTDDWPGVTAGKQ